MICLAIEPFNELLFKNCYYNILFSILKYFNVSLEYFMSNTIFSYDFSRSDSSVSSYLDIKSESVLLNEMGVCECDTIIPTSMVQQYLLDKIQANQPVLVVFRRSNGSFDRYVLIIGCDGVVAEIIERKNPETLSYTRGVISVCEIIEHCDVARAGVIKCTSFMFSEPLVPLDDAISVCLANYSLSKTHVYSSLSRLSQFIADLKSSFTLGTFSIDMHVISVLNDVISNCRVRQSIFNVDGKYDDVLVILARITSNWCLARNFLLKYLLSKRKLDGYADLVRCLEAVYDDELLFFDLIYFGQ